MASILQKLKITKRCFLLVIPITLWNPINAQENGNQSDKYADSYKKYLGATCPIIKDSIQQFVYFARNKEAIIDHPFLQHPVFKGAQIMYSWKDFEFQKGKYDFTILKQDYEYLKKFGKKLFIQLQDATFNPSATKQN
jgi:hypothetical protein